MNTIYSVYYLQGYPIEKTIINSQIDFQQQKTQCDCHVFDGPGLGDCRDYSE